MRSNYPYPLVTVGGLIVAKDGDILLVRSKKWSNLYTVPGGKVELGETLQEAFIREVHEETGLGIVNIRFAMAQDSIFSPEFFHKSHFVMNDFIADLAPDCTKEDVVLNAEAQEYRWVSPEEAMKMTLNRELYVLIGWYLSQKG
jgi:ADP-ribose pyrophosphatase YjhB (NUDIX family)